MSYKTIPVKNNIKDATKTEARKYMETQGSFSILWFLTRRHSKGLLASWAFVMTVLYLVPFAPDFVLNLF